jgi:hypothetical protein
MCPDVFADHRAVAVDRTHLDHWERELAARKRARRTLPPSWRRGERPELELVVDKYVELRASIETTRLSALEPDDR